VYLEETRQQFEPTLVVGKNASAGDAWMQKHSPNATSLARLIGTIIIVASH
jgi:hypothetical protein